MPLSLTRLKVTWAGPVVTTLVTESRTEAWKSRTWCCSLAGVVVVVGLPQRCGGDVGDRVGEGGLEMGDLVLRPARRRGGGGAPRRGVDGPLPLPVGERH